MLTIQVPELEYYDERTNSFGTIPARTLRLEHSLLSISKWESKWHKAYLETPGIRKDPSKEKTPEQIVDYLRCMSLDKDVNPLTYSLLPPYIVMQIRNYIDDPMTATWFTEQPGEKKSSSQTITSEIIYYWMIANDIPFECEKWHLNRLLTLIRVCNLKNQPKKNMSKNSISKQYRSLNSARRAKTGSKG